MTAVGRKAFGPHARKSRATHAKNIALSMVAHPGRLPEFYGVRADQEFYGMVMQVFERMTAKQAA